MHLKQASLLSKKWGALQWDKIICSDRLKLFLIFSTLNFYVEKINLNKSGKMIKFFKI
jgi:hypothetical protein